MPKNTEDEIIEVCNGVRDLLIQKNRAYGDSALKPKNIFSKLPADQAIRVRLDDKLSRIMGGNPKAFDEDPNKDIIGYLVLLMIAEKRMKQEEETRQYADIKDILPNPPAPTGNITATGPNPDYDRELVEFTALCKERFGGNTVCFHYPKAQVHKWQIETGSGVNRCVSLGTSQLEAINRMMAHLDAQTLPSASKEDIEKFERYCQKVFGPEVIVRYQDGQKHPWWIQSGSHNARHADPMRAVDNLKNLIEHSSLVNKTPKEEPEEVKEAPKATSDEINLFVNQCIAKFGRGTRARYDGDEAAPWIIEVQKRRVRGYSPESAIRTMMDCLAK